MASPASTAASPGFAARRAACLLVDGVLRRSQPLDEQLDAAKDPLFGLDQRDRGLARAIAGVSLRRLGSLRHALNALMRKPVEERGALDAILLTGAAQILFLDVPDHAAVSLAVDLARADRNARPFAPLVNGVLRNLSRSKDDIAAALSDPLLDTPDWLRQRRIADWGEEAARAMAEAERIEPSLDITARSDAANWAGTLGGRLLPTGTIRLIAHGAVTDMPGFAEGAWWVQDAAAALPAHLIAAQPDERVADLCAAPGGKTAQLAAAGADVTAVDRSAPRLRRLTANLERLHLSAHTVAADAAAFEAEPFDAVLLDAPCSATGTLRRHPDVGWLKGEEDVAKLAALQGRLLDAAADLLKPGGRLVYSTCSLERAEGEEQIAALLERRSDLLRDPIRPEELPGLSEAITAKGELRTFPYHLPDEVARLGGLDGFFAARLVRT